MVPKRKHLQLRLCRNTKVKYLNLSHIDIYERVVVLGTHTHHRKQNARNVRFQITCVVLGGFRPHSSHNLNICGSDENSARCILHSTTVNVFPSLVFDGRKQERHGDGHTECVHYGHVRCRNTRKVFSTPQVDTIGTYVYSGHCRAKRL